MKECRFDSNGFCLFNSYDPDKAVYLANMKKAMVTELSSVLTCMAQYVIEELFEMPITITVEKLNDGPWYWSYKVCCQEKEQVRKAQ
jgi:hypothetical protein